MSERVVEGPEVKETLKSLALLLDAVIKSIQEPTPQYIDWFIIKLNGIIPLCANKKASKKLQQVIKKLGNAKGKIQSEEIQADFYSLAQDAWKLIDEVLKTVA